MNVAEMSDQEIFSFVVEKMREQGAKSLSPLDERGSQVCAYRGSDGKKCAVGMIISDEDYRPEMEGFTLSEVLFRFPIFEEKLGKHSGLLMRLQFVHDQRDPDVWEYHWRMIAEDMNLTYVAP